jgi:hypothetical protein
VGFRLLLRVVNDSLVPPEWVMVLAIAAVFTWGFSKKQDRELDETIETVSAEAIGSEAKEEVTAEKIG